MQPHSIAQEANWEDANQRDSSWQALRPRAASFIRTIHTVGYVGTAPWETHQGHRSMSSKSTAEAVLTSLNLASDLTTVIGLS